MNLHTYRTGLKVPLHCKWETETPFSAAERFCISHTPHHHKFLVALWFYFLLWNILIYFSSYSRRGAGRIASFVHKIFRRNLFCQVDKWSPEMKWVVIWRHVDVTTCFSMIFHNILKAHHKTRCNIISPGFLLLLHQVGIAPLVCVKFNTNAVSFPSEL